MQEQISNESISSLKRNIEKEIKRIDQKILYITKLKEEAVDNLSKQKNECREKEIIGEIDDEIKIIQKRHTSVLERQKQIHETKQDYFDLDVALAEINNELMAIQERHEQVMLQLNEKRDFLQERLGSIEALKEMKVKVDEDFEAEIEGYEDDLARLKREREELLKRTDLSPSQMDLALKSIDEQIEQLEKAHIRKMSMLSQAAEDVKTEFSKTFSLDRKDAILQELEKLKSQAMNATPSELILIEARMEELNKELDQLQTLVDIQQGNELEELAEELEARGLTLTASGRILSSSGRIMSIQEAQELGLLDGVEVSSLMEREKLTALLEARGLTLTPSGRIRLDNGDVYTMEEARQLGLLQGLEDELMKMRGITLTASGRILTKDGKLMSRSEAGRLGLLDGINLDGLFAAESESETMSESTASSRSGMSSSDVHYLKTVLGRPLALALAEITAKQPRDPIHYLAHWMYKYRYNQEVDEAKKRELDELMEERERLAKAFLRQQAEADVRSVLMELLGRIDEQTDRSIMENELHRIETDAAAIEAEEAELESEARDQLGVYGGPTRGQQLI